jgi:DNA repair protein RadC
MNNYPAPCYNISTMQTKLYTTIPHAMILDNPERRYILKVRDLPPEQKPRERLMKHGAETLSTADLLAVVLGTGTKKEEILSMSARIMKEYGEKSIMSQKDPAALSRDLGIPLVKALQIVACAELGRRFFGKNEAASPVIRTAREVFEYVKDMRGLSKEHLRGIYLNTHYKVIRDEVISIGTVDANLVHPREVFKPALEYSAAAVILVHNHPSGSTKPSATDLEVTEQLVSVGKLLGIDLIDHVIVAGNSFLSIPVKYQHE